MLNGLLFKFILFYVILAAFFGLIGPSYQVSGLAGFQASIGAGPLAGMVVPGTSVSAGTFFPTAESVSCGAVVFQSIVSQPVSDDVTSFPANSTDWITASNLDGIVYDAATWTVHLKIGVFPGLNQSYANWTVRLGQIAGVSATGDPCTGSTGVFFDTSFQMDNHGNLHPGGEVWLNQSASSVAFTGNVWPGTQNYGRHNYLWMQLVRLNGNATLALKFGPQANTSYISHPSGAITSAPLDMALFFLIALIRVVSWALITMALFFGGLLSLAFSGAFGPFGIVLTALTSIFLILVFMNVLNWVRGIGGD